MDYTEIKCYYCSNTTNRIFTNSNNDERRICRDGGHEDKLISQNDIKKIYFEKTLSHFDKFKIDYLKKGYILSYQEGIRSSYNPIYYIQDEVIKKIIELIKEGYIKVKKQKEYIPHNYYEPNENENDLVFLINDENNEDNEDDEETEDDLTFNEKKEVDKDNSSIKNNEELCSECNSKTDRIFSNEKGDKTSLCKEHKTLNQTQVRCDFFKGSKNIPSYISSKLKSYREEGKKERLYIEKDVIDVIDEYNNNRRKRKKSEKFVENKRSKNNCCDNWKDRPFCGDCGKKIISLPICRDCEKEVSSLFCDECGKKV